MKKPQAENGFCLAPGVTIMLITKDKSFYKTFLPLMAMLILQNLISYSVNLADNVMLGSYSQTALSGAAAVNQIQFVLQQLTTGVGEGLVVLATQYWGKKETAPISRLLGIALCTGVFFGVLLTLAVSFFPLQVMYIFTDDAAICAEGMKYLSIMRFTYLVFIITNILVAALRSVETVKIAFAISISTFFLNIGINYTLIFGNFGAPEMGIVGAAIGTLVARCVELLIVVLYVIFGDKKLNLRIREMFRWNKDMVVDYFKISFPVLITQTLFGVSVSMQTAVLGHLTADAIAANSAATTFYQFLKIVVVGEASATSVVIGKTIGQGKVEKVREYAKTLQVFYIITGVLVAGILFACKDFLLSFYVLNDEAMKLARQIMLLLCVVYMGMSYQMPTATGIIRGGGDTKFVLWNDLICIWGIMYPLVFLAAFYWKLPVIAVVAFLNSDQVFKCIPVAIKVNRYRWMKKLTK